MPTDQRAYSSARDDDDLPGSYLRRLRDAPYDSLLRLSEDASVRQATSIGEARAAAYLDGRLRRAGLRVSADSFPAQPSPGWEGLVVAALALSALGVYYWLPFLTIVLNMAALLITVAALLRGAAPLFRKELPSQNVIGTRAATESQRHRLVLLARLDSPPPYPGWAARLGVERLPALRAAAAAIALALAVAGAFDPQRLWLYLQVAPAVLLALLGLADALARYRQNRPAPAHHAAGLAVLLASCERMDELQHTELWAVGLGATASGAGLADLLRRYPFDIDTTCFVGLEGLGEGEPRILASEGWPQALPADARLAELAARSAADARVGVGTALSRSGATLGASLLRSEHRALTVACLGAGQRPQGIVAEDLERATRLVNAIARGLDTL